MGRVTRIRVIEFSLIPIDLPLLLSLSLYSFIVHRRTFFTNTTNSKRFESLDTGKRNLENRLALTSGVGLARGGEKSRSGDRKPGKVRQGTPLWHRHPRWLSKLRVRLNFICQIFFSKFRNSPSPLYPPLPLSFPLLSFLFSLPIKTSKIFLDTRLSVCWSKNSRNSNETYRKRKRETTCSTWKYNSRLLSGPNSAWYFHGTSFSASLSLSLRQTLLKPREARSRRIHGGKRSNRVAFSGTRFENSVNWPFLN